MRSLSQAAWLLVDLLERGWSHLSAEQQEQARWISELGQTGEAAALPRLAAILPQAGGRVADATRQAIQAIVDASSVQDLVEVDRAVRYQSNWDAQEVRPSDVSRLAGGLTNALGILSFNAYGYVRQRAVELLAQADDGRELAFLLIRLNDWVAEVRELARKAVSKRLRPEYAAHFVRCLPLVHRLRRQGRADHTYLTEQILQFLRSSASRPSLLAAVGSPDRHVRRLAFRLLADMPGDDEVPTLMESLGSDDTVIRLWAAQELRKHLTGEPLRKLLDRLLVDRFVPIRREALCGFAEQFPELNAERLIPALADEHASIREVARFYLRQAGTTDFTMLYRGWLRAGEGGLAGAVAGLAETGTRADAAVLLQYAHHPLPRVRRAAIRGIGRLDPDPSRNIIVNALRDDSPAVRKAAREVILAHMHLITPGELRALFESAKDAHAQLVLLPIVQNLNWWDSAFLLVMAVGTGEEQVRAKAANGLLRWRRNVGRLSARPTLQQMELLDDALSGYGGLLDPAVRGDLVSAMSYAKREHLGIR